jgi:hydroxymethylpyrimidine/phosphomethylpyrimidine kinase
MPKLPRVLAIAGSDSGGGAGIQADIKTITALGGFATTAITAITAQNTLGVTAIETLSAGMVTAQIQAVLSDIGTDAIKTGMLANAEIIAAIADALTATSAPLVLDPVMIATSGARLIDPSALDQLAGRLFARAHVITPNIPEAEALTGLIIHDRASMLAAATNLLALGPQAVLIKGGHLPGEHVIDLLLNHDGARWFEDPKIDTRHTHGTGCTLASAIATGVAQGMLLFDAVARARHYVRRAIETAPGFGHGHGPLNHGFSFQP